MINPTKTFINYNPLYNLEVSDVSPHFRTPAAFLWYVGDLDTRWNQVGSKISVKPPGFGGLIQGQIYNLEPKQPRVPFFMAHLGQPSRPSKMLHPRSPWSGKDLRYGKRPNQQETETNQSSGRLGVLGKSFFFLVAKMLVCVFFFWGGGRWKQSRHFRCFLFLPFLVKIIKNPEDSW